MTPIRFLEIDPAANSGALSVGSFVRGRETRYGAFWRRSSTLIFPIVVSFSLSFVQGDQLNRSEIVWRGNMRPNIGKISFGPTLAHHCGWLPGCISVSDGTWRLGNRNKRRWDFAGIHHSLSPILPFSY
ncbi:hypothetical protein BDZ89DRAFT_82372 [Hymenopellis radicata]|nr:hypothetical protein BDZ89DRAFT_82372 [Hymenopellis radicata]